MFRFFIFSTLVFSTTSFATVTLKYSADGGVERVVEHPNPDGDITFIIKAKALAGWSRQTIQWVDLTPAGPLNQAAQKYLEFRKAIAPNVTNEEITLNLELGRGINPYDYEIKPSDAEGKKFEINELDVGGDISAQELKKFQAIRAKYDKSYDVPISGRMDMPDFYYTEIFDQFACALGKHLVQHHVKYEAEEISGLLKRYFQFDEEFGKTYLNAAKESAATLIKKQFSEFVGVCVMWRFIGGQDLNSVIAKYYEKIFPSWSLVARSIRDKKGLLLKNALNELVKRSQTPLALILKNLELGQVDGTFAYNDLKKFYDAKKENAYNPASEQHYENAKVELLTTLESRSIQKELPRIFLFGESPNLYDCRAAGFRIVLMRN